MGQAIEHNFRGTDIIGRIGGDEFIVLFRNSTNMDVLRNRCSSLISKLSRTYADGNNQLAFSISIGIALYPARRRWLPKSRACPQAPTGT